MSEETEIELCECFRCGGQFPFEELHTIRFGDDQVLLCENCKEEL